MAVVELHRDPIGDGVALLELRPWLRPTSGRYWHQPRSASVVGPPHPRPGIIAHLWCGQGRFGLRLDDFVDDAPEELRCGTCMGRRLGYDQADGLIFRPADHWRLPARCPGSSWESTGRYCWACGARAQAARGWNAWGMARHRPGPALAELQPCPRHGWRDMRDRDGVLVCNSWRCEHSTRRQ